MFAESPKVGDIPHWFFSGTLYCTFAIAYLQLTMVALFWWLVLPPLVVVVYAWGNSRWGRVYLVGGLVLVVVVVGFGSRKSAYCCSGMWHESGERRRRRSDGRVRAFVRLTWFHNQSCCTSLARDSHSLLSGSVFYMHMNKNCLIEVYWVWLIMENHVLAGFLCGEWWHWAFRSFRAKKCQNLILALVFLWALF